MAVIVRINEFDELCLYKKGAMILKLDEHITVAALQDKFSECFPGLKIEFYKGRKALKQGRPADSLLHVSELTKKHHNGEMAMKTWNKADKVITQFKEEYGLLVRLFRLHQGTWRLLGDEEELTPEPPAHHMAPPVESNTGGEEDVPLAL